MTHEQRLRAVARRIAEREHEVWLDEAILMHLSALSGAQLTPRQEAQSWVGEAVCMQLDAKREEET